MFFCEADLIMSELRVVEARADWTNWDGLARSILGVYKDIAYRIHVGVLPPSVGLLDLLLKSMRRCLQAPSNSAAGNSRNLLLFFCDHLQEVSCI